MSCSMLSKLVAFDTNVYMGSISKDRKIIAQVLRSWSLISPSIVILVPIVSFLLGSANSPTASGSIQSQTSILVSASYGLSLRGVALQLSRATHAWNAYQELARRAHSLGCVQSH